jgi:DNA invertase Pin-like site-specific DNA recombinase
MTIKDTCPAAPGYSYIRFSSTQQIHGDSVRRQTLAAQDWCARHGVRLDEALTFRDLGKSAYLGEHRKNPDRCALAAFLKLVQDGRVPRGSYLVIESLDRLTREHVRAGLMLLLGLIEAGIRIVQLSPSELVYDEKSDEMGLMLAIVELSRGHRESKRKSDLITSVWNKRKQQARESKTPYTGMLPAWIEDRDGTLELIPARAAVVERIFRMTIDGYGLTSIVRKLAEEKVPTFGEVIVREGRKRSQFSGKWSRAYLSKILRDRRAVGEFQPCRREGHKKVPDGDPVPGYFPAVVSESDWLATRAAASERRDKPGRLGKNINDKPGRLGKNINLFSGLVKHARDGDTYMMVTKVDGHASRVHRSPARKILVNMRSAEGDAPGYSFPFAVFERAVLSGLAEIDPHDILDGDQRAGDEVLTLSRELAGIEARSGELEAELLKGDVAALAKVLRKLEERKRELAAQLADARHKAANPLSESWGEAKTLLGVLEKAPDPTDAQLRLRSALRRIVENIWLLVVPRGRGRDRLAAVQIDFREGARRSYLILYSPPKSNGKALTPGWWKVRSWTLAEHRAACVPEQPDLSTRQGVDVEGPDGRTHNSGGWEDAELFLRSLSADDLDRLVFGGCERRDLP